MNERAPVLRVLKPGVLSTVQDRGRRGHRRFGVPASGALDLVSYSWANRIVGNVPGAAAIEAMWGGLEVEALSDTTVAVAGASAGLNVDGTQAEMWKPLEMKRGSVLKVGAVEAGHIDYLAVAGGIGGDSVLGSVSTYLRGGFGGFGGRSLTEGDVLGGDGRPSGNSSLPNAENRRVMADSFRLVLGPHSERLEDGALDDLLAGGFEISMESDRVGYRLQGPRPMTFAGGYRDEVSFAVYPGMIQVPPDGAPILLMADCGTTGGYPVVGMVIQPDLSALAQAEPTQSLKFVRVEQTQALEETGRFTTFLDE